jgi:hypothetical protein
MLGNTSEDPVEGSFESSEIVILSPFVVCCEIRGDTELR